MTSVAELARSDATRWHAATHHPFLDGARTGDLPAAAFDRWLEQDRHFVETLTRAWAAILVRAPAHDLALLADGIGAFVAELTWFDDVTATHGRSPGPVLPATAAYDDHLLRVATQPHVVALAAMWTVEVAYLEAWRTALPGAPAYRRFVEHWTDAAFGEFVARLEAAADRALREASPHEVEGAARAVTATLDHEAAFWAMTWSG
jgi:thiaminase/transcriptional activator TenA